MDAGLRFYVIILLSFFRRIGVPARKQPKSVKPFSAIAALLLIFLSGNLSAQAPTSFSATSLNSDTPGLLQLQTTAWLTLQDYFSSDLNNQPPGEYLVQAFDAPTGLPNSGYVLTGASVHLWMWQPTGITGSLFPEVKLFLNGPAGTPVCTMTSSTALVASMDSPFTLGCSGSAPVPVTPSDRYYLWVGFTSTATPAMFTQVKMIVGTVFRGSPRTDLTLSLTPIPNIGGLNPGTGPVGTQVKISGFNFGTTQGTSSAQIGTQQLDIISWSDTAILASIPQGAASGNVVVTNGTQTSNPVPFTVTETPGALFGSYSHTLTSVTLTSSSVFDWAHWGTSPDAPFVTKQGILTDFSVIGTGTPTPFSDGEIEYSWTDGDVLPSIERTKTGVSITGVGNGFHLTVPADTTPRTLILYLGAWEAQGRITASLSDNAVPAFTDTPIDIVAANGDHHVNGTYALTFQASQPGQTLSVDYVMATDHGAASGLAGYVSLESASLVVPALPSITLTSPADNQVSSSLSDVTVTAVASQIGAPINTVSFFSDGQKLVDINTPPFSFSISGLPPGDHVLTATATDANGLTASSSPTLVTKLNAAGSGVVGGIEESALATDLSVSMSDWVHWGGTVPDRRAVVTPQISDFTTLANGSAHSFDASTVGGVNYSWSFGAPTDSQAGTATQMRMQGFKNGFSFTVPADTTTRFLRLFIASGYGEVTLQASLSDGSGTPYIDVFSTPTAFNERKYNITFQAGSAGQKLTITGQVTRDDGFAYVALESASVQDWPVPQVDTVTPATAAPGDQITITGSSFGVQSAGSVVSLNGVAMNVVSWTDSSITAIVPLVKSGPIVVSQGLANSNSVAFTVILPPPPAVSFISPAAGVAGTPVTIFGSNFGNAQFNSTITFNGVPAIPTSWSDTQIVTAAPPGVHSGAVVVTTLSGPSNGVQFTFAPGIRFSLQSVYVTPDETNLEVGGSSTLTLIDPSGAPITDASWSVDNSTLASISADTSTSSQGILQALAPGEVTITATSSLGTAQAVATIFAAGTAPPGTAAWGFYPQVQDNFFEVTVKARRINPDDPYMYVPEGTGALEGTLVNALDENGRLQWRATLSPITPTNTIFFPTVAPGTDDGGILVQTNEADPNGPAEATGFYRLAPDGKPLWTYSVPTVDTSTPSIGPDGTIYFWSEDTSGIFLIALDDATGTEKFRIDPLNGSAPIFTSSEQPGPINPDRTAVTASNPWKPCADFFPPGSFFIPNPAGGNSFSFTPVVGTDGSLYVMEADKTVSYNYNSCFLTNFNASNPDDPPSYFVDTISGQLDYTESLQLLRISPSGSVSTTQIASTSYSGLASFANSGQWKFNNGASQLPVLDFDQVVPNADGGALMTWAQTSSTLGDSFHGFLTNVIADATASTAALPFQSEDKFGFNGFGTLVTNDVGTVFFDGGTSVTAFDISTGAPNWTLAGSLMAATDDGGILITTSDSSVHAADASGTLSTDSLLLGARPSYLAEGIFLQNSIGGSVQAVPASSDQLTKLLAVPWPVPTFSNPQQSFRAKGEKITQLSQGDLPVGQTEGCTGFDSVSVDVPAVMAPASGTNPVTNATVPESGNTFNYRAPKGIDERLIPDDANLLTLSVDDPLNPDKLVAIVPGDGVSHKVTVRGHGTANPPNGIIVRAFDATSNALKGAVFQGIVSPYRFWQVHEFEIGDASNNTPSGTAPSSAQIAAELNRIFKAQANIEFGVIDRGIVNSFHWDQHPSDNKMHYAKLWDFPAFKINSEAGPLNNYITTVFDGQTSPLLTQGYTMYLYYVKDFDDASTEGFTVRRNRSIPSLVKTNYSLQINFSLFMSNLTAHEFGHKLGLDDRRYADKDFVMDGIRTGTEIARGQNTPCKLSLKEWITTNEP